MFKQQVISRRRSKKGEIILTFDFTSFKHWLIFIFFKLFLQPLYSFLKYISLSLSQVTGKKGYLIVTSGLGLGLGLGMILAFYPQPIQALPGIINNYEGVEITRIKSSDLGIDTEVTRGEAVVLLPLQLEAPAIHLQSSASVGRGQPIIIQGLNKDYSLQNLTQAQLGDEIFVIGSNGGWYRYRVVETRVVQLENLNDFFSQSREVVILYTLNFWDKTAQVVMARPRI